MSLSIYKRGQGKYTRLGTVIAVAVVAGLGCYQLYTMLEVTDLNPWVATMVPAGLFVVCGLVALWLDNKPSVADFMIAAEGEMKKVSWSTRNEIVVSTLVVIVVVVIFAIMLGITDIGFRLFFNWLLDVQITGAGAV